MSDLAGGAPPSAPAPSSTPAVSTPTPSPAAGTTSATPTPAPGTETVAEKKSRIHKLKVDGVESEVDLDSYKDEDLVRELQMAKASRARMQEAAETRKAFRALQDAVKKDPISALKDPAFAGVDVRKMVEEQLIREYQESQMDEPSRKAAQLQRELEQERGKLAEYEGKQKAEAQRVLEERVYGETQRDFIQALETSGLPKTRETLSIMAQIAAAALDNGIDLTPAQISTEAKRRVQGLHQHVTSSLKGDALIAHLGESVVNEVIKHRIAQVKAKKGLPTSVPTTQDVVEPGDRPERKQQDFGKMKKFFKGL